MDSRYLQVLIEGIVEVFNRKLMIEDLLYSTARRPFRGLLWIKYLLEIFNRQNTFWRPSMDRRYFAGLLSRRPSLFYGQRTIQGSSMDIFWRYLMNKSFGGLLQMTSNGQKTFCIPRIEDFLGVFYVCNTIWRSSMDRRTFGGLL